VEERAVVVVGNFPGHARIEGVQIAQAYVLRAAVEGINAETRVGRRIALRVVRVRVSRGNRIARAELMIDLHVELVAVERQDRKKNELAGSGVGSGKDRQKIRRLWRDAVGGNHIAGKYVADELPRRGRIGARGRGIAD